jgi:hypothetical protein
VAAITWQFIIYVFYAEGVFDGVYALLNISPDSPQFLRALGTVAAIGLLELPLLAGIGYVCLRREASPPGFRRLRVPAGPSAVCCSYQR